MRHFDQEELAKRYAAYRPQVHGEVIAKLAEHLELTEKVAMAVDVACGTGHGTLPLLELADHVTGCDVSDAMLTEARAAYPVLEFRRASAENLPFPNASVDLVTVGFAFHWFDQPAFLREAARVLGSGGRLAVYNMVFPGDMVGNDTYKAWHKEVYLTKYPSPPRKSRPLSELLGERDYGLTLVEGVKLSLPVQFTAHQLRNYLTTQSNIDVALQAGASLAEIDAWLNAALRPFFTNEKEVFAYFGGLTIVRRA